MLMMLGAKIAKSEFQTVNMPGWPSIELLRRRFKKVLALLFKCGKGLTMMMLIMMMMMTNISTGTGEQTSC